MSFVCLPCRSVAIQRGLPRWREATLRGGLWSFPTSPFHRFSYTVSLSYNLTYLIGKGIRKSHQWYPSHPQLIYYLIHPRL